MIAVLALSIIPPAVSGAYTRGPAPSILWNKTYDFPTYGWASSLYLTSDGGYIVTGMTKDPEDGAFLIKTSSDGDLQWVHTYGGGGDASGERVIQTADGGYAIAGEATMAEGHYTDLFLIKTYGDGQVQWTWTYGTEGPDWSKDVIATDDGYVLAGFVYASNNNGYTGCDGYLVKVGFDGQQKWARTYIEPGAHSETFNALKVTSDGNFIIAGILGNTGLCLVKVKPDGDQLWLKQYDIDVHDVCDVQQTSDGGYIVSGSGGSGLFLLRTDSDGNKLWYQSYDTFARQLSGTVEQMPDGGFIAGGACLVRTDKDGNLLWSELTYNNFRSYGTALVVNDDGSFTVAGGGYSMKTTITPILIRTMPASTNVTATPATAPAIISNSTGLNQSTEQPSTGWINTAMIAGGIFVLVAGVLIILLIIVLIVDKRINRQRKK